MKQTFLAHSADETMAWASNFAQSLKPGDILCLYGDLGAGKTTFVKGLAQGLGVKKGEHVTSPTFAIMHRYACRIPFYHFDCYRIQSPEELTAIGFEDFVNSGEGITCIEWPQKAGHLIPKKSISVSFIHQGEFLREIQIER